MLPDFPAFSDVSTISDSTFSDFLTFSNWSTLPHLSTFPSTFTFLRWYTQCLSQLCSRHPRLSITAPRIELPPLMERERFFFEFLQRFSKFSLIFCQRARAVRTRRRIALRYVVLCCVLPSVHHAANANSGSPNSRRGMVLAKI